MAPDHPFDHIDEIIAAIRPHAEEILGTGATSLYIFGLDDNELEAFVDYSPEACFSLVDLAHVYRVLTDATGREVHVTTRAGFPPHQLPSVEARAVKVL
jgi:predicted nucleotidyltransferase